VSVPQFSVPEPPEGFFRNELWAPRFMRRGMSADRAAKLAEIIARKRWLMPVDIAHAYLARLRRNLEDNIVRP